jgi:hypothetical protein
MQPVFTALSSSRDLVVVSGTVTGSTMAFAGQGATQTTIIGQQSAVVGSVGTPAFSMQGGSVFLRGVTFSATSAIGVKATGGTLALDDVVVDSCTGGGVFLDGAAFTIANSKITNNSGGRQGAFSWGGILVNSLPPSGSATLHLVTIENNRPNGINCAGPLTGDGVLATANMSADIDSNCGFVSCGTAGPTCGAQ